MFTLPNLPYVYSALEPFIDAKTMEIHHTKHHQAYIDKLNKALEKYPELQKKSAEELIKNLESIPEDIRTAVRNNAGGHINHSFFWLILKKGIKPEGEIIEAIKRTFGSFEKFQEEFNTKSVNLFGSGWCWLVLNKDKKLEVITTPNQDSPIMLGKKPILGIDLWEHAYYLKYQNRRSEYVNAFWNVINWKVVNENFLKAKR
ncbi:MAG: hypothetical protein KatS3mg001_008 [Candidatus Pacearchaeota archaeon]|nr:MAG: hypothetical protein KatS3mg001_008 [Candidatus Pacearchaeota archaeon]